LSVANGWPSASNALLLPPRPKRNFYYQKQIQTKTPMVVVLQNGEQVHGVIEWYDRNCIKLNRAGASNLLIYKPSIKYMYKESESR
jgi:host factor-I protein